MRYLNLKELLRESEDARKQFRSYPPQTQVLLCEFAEEIHSGAELILTAGRITEYLRKHESPG